MWELQESPPSPRAVELRYCQVVSSGNDRAAREGRQVSIWQDSRGD
jgi:hypothetical protein